MMEDITNRFMVSFVGVLASWGLMDVSLVLASIASICTIIHATLGIKKILDESEDGESD
jgi:energy-converting hydrogenase Eha subunit C